MKKLLLIFIFSGATAFAEVEFPFYGYTLTKDALVLQVPTCKNRETKVGDLACFAYASSTLEEGTGATKKVVDITCSAAKDDETSWCKAGDKFLAFGKTITIAYKDIKAQLDKDPREDGDTVAKFITKDYDVSFSTGLLIPTPTKDRTIDEP